MSKTMEDTIANLKQTDSRDLLIAALQDDVQFLRETVRTLLYERIELGQFEIGAALRDKRKQI